MNSRERIQTALKHQEPDRVPFFASFTPEISERLRRELNIREFDLGVALGNDMAKDCVGLERSFYYSPEQVYTCPWEIKWRYFQNETGRYTEIIDYPLAGDEDKLNRFQIPDPLEEQQYTGEGADLALRRREVDHRLMPDHHFRGIVVFARHGSVHDGYDG